MLDSITGFKTSCVSSPFIVPAFFIVPFALSFTITANPTVTTSPAFTLTFQVNLLSSTLYVPSPYMLSSINVVCSGIISEILIPFASSLPVFITANTYVKISPALTELFSSDVADTFNMLNSGLYIPKPVVE